MRYHVHHDYKAGPFSTRDGGDVNWKAGDEIELDADEAAFRNQDSAGVLTPVGDLLDAETDELDEKTVKELHALADERGIDLAGATKKADIIETIKTAERFAATGVEVPDGGSGEISGDGHARAYNAAGHLVASTDPADTADGVTIVTGDEAPTT